MVNRADESYGETNQYSNPSDDPMQGRKEENETDSGMHESGSRTESYTHPSFPSSQDHKGSKVYSPKKYRGQ